MNLHIFEPTCWEVIERRVIHDFDEAETPLRVVAVNIGNFEGSPIIRWMTEEKYAHYIKCATC